jgi:hypothetical protein
MLSFFHYDLYAQALAKIERGHALDVTDVEEMFRRALIEPTVKESFRSDCAAALPIPRD